MWRISKILFLSSILLITIGSLAGFLIAWYYQDKVKDLMLNEINRHVLTQIRVRDISFSVLRKFPHASVEFKDVVIMAPGEYKFTGLPDNSSDTLFTAESVFLQFNLRNLIRKEYKANRIHAVNGILNLTVNSQEEENFRFWKQSESEAGEFNMDLQDVRLTGYRIKYSSSLKHIYLDSDVKRLEMKGNFNQASTRITGYAQGSNREFRNGDVSFSGNQDVSVKLAFTSNGNIVNIEEGSINVSGIRLEVLGTYESGDPGSIQMDLKGQNLDISSALMILNEEHRIKLRPYQINGKFNFEATVSGNYSKTVSPGINARISTENGEIIRKDTGMRLTGINLSGNFSNGISKGPVSSTITIHNFSSQLGSGNISGNGRIYNLSQPVVDINVKTTFLLEEVAEFYKPENILQMRGSINTAFSAKGELQKPFKWDIGEVTKMNLNGELEIRNGLLEISSSRHVASGIDGLLHFGNTLVSENLSFNIGSDHFSLNGKIENGLPWLLGTDQVMSITGSLFSRNLDLDNYITPSTETTSNSGNNDLLQFPDNLELSLDFLIDDLRVRKFYSTKFRGKLSYKPKMMILNEVEFNSMDGIVSGNGVIAQKVNGEFMLQSQLQLQKINIQKMFLTFNNFGQTFIHGEHLNGSLDGTLGLISEWSPDLKLKRERIIADSKVEIRNGELIAFEPMLGLARFIHVSELNHIKFSVLRNEIFIRDKVVTIPQMDVNSSAFNIAGSGTHHFEGKFDYHLKVLLSDVLYGRARTSKPENQKFGIVEDDGLGRTSLYLLVSGITDDYRVSYDHRAVRDVIRENIASERNVLKQLLNKEFGWFSSDSINAASAGMDGNVDSRINAPPSPVREQERRFQITWDEEETPPIN